MVLAPLALAALTMRKLFDLTWVFALLGVLAVGGGTAILPEMQRITIHHFHWITDRQFRDIYGLGQVAPGPNMLMVLVIGYRLAGGVGAACVGTAFLLPDCIIALVANRLWERFGDAPWRVAAQRGLAPVAIGLMLSGTWAIARLSVMNLTGLTIAIAAFAILWLRRINPIILITAGGLFYLGVRVWG
jgi:chromate transporter